MKIICAGMRRSGSTWLYNVIRLGLNAHGRFEDTWSLEDNVPTVKTHKFSPQFLFSATRVVTSHRDLRDVAASAVRRRLIMPNPVEVIRYLLRAAIDEYSLWIPHANYDMNFERMMADKEAEAKAIFGALGIKADASTTCNLVDNLPLATGETDQEILLAKNHFTGGIIGGYKDTLPKDSITAIEAVFGHWLKGKGYTV